MLVVGVGGLGSAAAMALARAGVGTIGLADPDRVELSNLHRQLLHTTADVGAFKVESAARKLVADEGGPIVSAHPYAVTDEEAPALFALHDFVIDATDRPSAKYLLNDAAVRSGVPLSHAGVVGFGGQLFTVLPGRSACLRCAFPEAPADDEAIGCREAGVLGPVAAILGALQADEAVRTVTGRGAILADRLLAIDGKTFRAREARLTRDPDCSACGPFASTHSPDLPAC